MGWLTNFYDEQLQQEFEYTLLSLIVTTGEFQKCNLTL